MHDPKEQDRFRYTVESQLYVQVGTQFGRRTDCERDVQVKIIFRITPDDTIPTGRIKEWDLQLENV